MFNVKHNLFINNLANSFVNVNNTLYNIVSLINTAFFVYSKVLWLSPVPWRIC
jgi:hypothetical protein